VLLKTPRASVAGLAGVVAEEDSLAELPRGLELPWRSRREAALRDIAEQPFLLVLRGREYSAEARRRWQVVKAEELARKECRSRCGRLKQVDMTARKRGVDIHRHLAAIDREIGLAEQLVSPAT
jgi:hypothetical protein